MTPAAETYIAGVCNIGKEEIRARWFTGWASAAVTAMVWVGMRIFDLDATWHWILALPAMSTAAGFSQAKAKFCFNFGLRKMFNFSKLGATTTIQDKKDIRLDRQRSWQIIGVSLAIGIAVAGTAVAVA